jgi:hypothetical protein
MIYEMDVWRETIGLRQVLGNRKRLIVPMKKKSFERFYAYINKCSERQLDR